MMLRTLVIAALVVSAALCASAVHMPHELESNVHSWANGLRVPPHLSSDAKAPRHLLLVGGIIDTRLMAATGLSTLNLALGGGETSFAVQLAHPAQDHVVAVEAALGRPLSHYLPHNAYLVTLTVAEALRLRTVEGVEWVGLLPDSARIAPHVEDWVTRVEAAEVDDTVSLHVLVAEHRRTELAALVAKWANELERVTGATIAARVASEFKIVVEMPAAVARKAVAVLARTPMVEWVEPAPEYRLWNDMGAAVGQNGSAVPYRVASAAGLTGRGMIAQVADTGLDAFTPQFYDAKAEVAYDGAKDTGHRKISQYTCFADCFDYEGGHGTHVSGSVMGQSVDKKWEQYDGSAYEARMAFFDIGNDQGGLSLPDTIETVFQTGKKFGAHLSSNSWGTPVPKYMANDQEVDRYMYENPDFLVLFAAGNDGTRAPGFGNVGSPAISKNSVTIGASMTTHAGWLPRLPIMAESTFQQVREVYICDASSDLYKNPRWCDSLDADTPCADEADAACAHFTQANDTCGNAVLEPICCPAHLIAVYEAYPQWYQASNMAYFSSRGPALDQRVLPDLVSIGHVTLSANSGGYGQTGPNHRGIKSMSGTSMATPTAAGLATLVQQYFKEGHGDSAGYTGGALPNSALIKAVMMAGADNLDGIVDFDGQNNWVDVIPAVGNHQGAGRINLGASLNLKKKVQGPLLGVWEAAVSTDHSAKSHAFAVPSTGSVRVALSFNDYPASPIALQDMVNKLGMTLKRIRANGTVELLEMPAKGFNDVKMVVVVNNMNAGDSIEVTVNLVKQVKGANVKFAVAVVTYN